MSIKIKRDKMGFKRSQMWSLLTQQVNKLQAFFRDSHSKAIALTVLSLGLTFLFVTLAARDVFATLGQSASALGPLIVIELTVFAILSIFLLYGNVIYHITRIGYFVRHGDKSTADRCSEQGSQSNLCVTVLIPSYREEVAVIQQTILSAALMRGPRRRIVLLIDDPPVPTTDEDCKLLWGARSIPEEIEGAFASVRARSVSLAAVESSGSEAAREQLSDLYTLFADALERLSGHFTMSHTDKFFVDKILRPPMLECRRISEILHKNEDTLPLERRRDELLNSLDFSVSTFERKMFDNLSHAPNKAMNLNSYIGLLGGAYREREVEGKRILEKCRPEEAEWAIESADFLITLDADSLLLPDYAATLLRVMLNDSSGQIAVAQTPYTAIPGASSTVERIAGATTDIQHIIHQGFSLFESAYWVGANALLRVSALRTIKTEASERGYTFSKFIEDRTVIEDTESSIDLIRKGWRIYNYPAKLAYSATPSDFGSLLVQRRRWSNGGLLILPKLIDYIKSQPIHSKLLLQFAVRAHYLVSIALSNFSILFFLILPFSSIEGSIWLPLTAAPYYVLYGIDLRRLGYRSLDLLRVYALNLLLIPVQLGGVIRSMHQWFTGHKSAFVRTPKIPNRTAAPAGYVISIYALTGICFLGALHDWSDAHYAHMSYALANGIFLMYAIIAFVGVKNSFSDIVERLCPTIQNEDRQHSRIQDSIMIAAGFLLVGLISGSVFNGIFQAIHRRLINPSIAASPIPNAADTLIIDPTHLFLLVAIGLASVLLLRSEWSFGKRRFAVAAGTSFLLGSAGYVALGLGY